MRSTLKPYFLGGFSKGLREKYTNTSSKDLPKRAKKMALRLDGSTPAVGRCCYETSLSLGWL